MTKREKSVIVIFILVTIAVCGFVFIIKPLMQTRLNNKIEIEEKTREKAQVVALIAEYPEVQKKLNESKTVFENDKKSFHPVMQAWEAEREVTNTMKTTGLTVVSVAVSPPMPFVPIDKLVSSVATTSQTTQANQSAANVITVTVEFKATIEQLKDYLDNISHPNKKTAINIWNYSVKDDVLKGTINVNLYCMK